MAILETSTILDALSPEQREIVTCLEGPVLVLARVGSGKTRVLAHRAAYALIAGPFGGERSVGLALTFTNRAAEEMLERLEGLLSPALNGRVSVCTFHALAARVLRAEGKRIGVLPSFQVYDDTESGELLEHVMGRLHVPWTDNDG